MADLGVTFAGLHLRNPLIAAAGPITASVEMVSRLADAGVAAAVTKTGFVRTEYEQWIGRKDVFPYKPVYKYQGLHRGRLLSLPTLAELPAEDLARRIPGMKRTGIPVIGSVMGLSVEKCARNGRDPNRKAERRNGATHSAAYIETQPGGDASDRGALGGAVGGGGSRGAGRGGAGVEGLRRREFTAFADLDSGAARGGSPDSTPPSSHDPQEPILG